MEMKVLRRSLLFLSRRTSTTAAWRQRRHVTLSCHVIAIGTSRCISRSIGPSVGRSVGLSPFMLCVRSRNNCTLNMPPLQQYNFDSNICAYTRICAREYTRKCARVHAFMRTQTSANARAYTRTDGQAVGRNDGLTDRFSGGRTDVEMRGRRKVEIKGKER